MFFHPDHIIPTVKFIAAFMKRSNHCVPHVTVKFHTVMSQIVVFITLPGNTGIGIEYILEAQALFKGRVKAAADA